MNYSLLQDIQIQIQVISNGLLSPETHFSEKYLLWMVFRVKKTKFSTMFL